jgi:ATP adenylyltransferase/5',5'''-P-1,P-4-tetraphosphate phosphorylase II
MNIESTDPQESTNPTLLIASVKGSVLYTDFERINFLPEIDVMLDWRNRLNKRKEDDVLNPQEWYDREIRAVDYLLSLHCP